MPASRPDASSNDLASHPDFLADHGASATLLRASLLTRAELQVLWEIVSFAAALREKSASKDSQSYKNVWRAYDAVLAHHHIDPAHDSLYFRVILQVQAAPGATLQERFMHHIEVCAIWASLERG